MNKLAATNIGESLFGGPNPLNEGVGGKALGGIGSFVTVFLNVAFIGAGLILLFFFILGGIGMISSAGQDNPQKAEQAKKTITSAVIGFVIVFASYWIVKLIGQLLGVSDLIF